MSSGYRTDVFNVCEITKSTFILDSDYKTNIHIGFRLQNQHSYWIQTTKPTFILDSDYKTNIHIGFRLQNQHSYWIQTTKPTFILDSDYKMSLDQQLFRFASHTIQEEHIKLNTRTSR
ncbi:hypothetical protein CEXT_67591 [Caerostris extrusa]|uniref:Uncharacterized protein n=1 Tax=Caerostris extrusa TaxID=172846 RepID=A0AAV4MLF6_CAEEX|nr:hypothetical protein CEXT_67591 [Caerostris extrusa]